MAIFSIDDLTTPLTVDEVKTSIYQVLATVGVDTTNWKPGAVVRTMIAAVAIVVSSLSGLIALIARSGFLALAAGKWLTLVARYVYGVERIAATFASGSVTLNNAGGGVYAYDPGDLTFVNTRTGKTYRNTAIVNIPALTSGIVVALAAVEAGSASSAFVGEVILETVVLGVSGTNAAAVLGTDEELDPDLRARCSAKLGALSPNGPWDAYASAARGAKRLDGTPIGVTRVAVQKDGFGNVSVYCATASGVVPGSSSDPGTDLGAINEAIQRQATPLAITSNVFSVVAAPLSITYRVWMYNTLGLTDAQVELAIVTALGAWVPLQPIGGNIAGSPPGYVHLDAIRAAIANATSNGERLPIYHVELLAPLADVALGAASVVTLGTVIADQITQRAP